MMNAIPKIAMLNKLLPKIFPITKSALSGKRIVALMEVNNSGNEVTAAKNTVPINAPLILVFLSNASV